MSLTRNTKYKQEWAIVHYSPPQHATWQHHKYQVALKVSLIIKIVDTKGVSLVYHATTEGSHKGCLLPLNRRTTSTTQLFKARQSAASPCVLSLINVTGCPSCTLHSHLCHIPSTLSLGRNNSRDFRVERDTHLYRYTAHFCLFGLWVRSDI